MKHDYESGYHTKAAAAGNRAGIMRSSGFMLRKEDLEYSYLRVVDEYLFIYFIDKNFSKYLFTRFVNGNMVNLINFVQQICGKFSIAMYSLLGHIWQTHTVFDIRN